MEKNSGPIITNTSAIKFILLSIGASWLLYTIIKWIEYIDAVQQAESLGLLSPIVSAISQELINQQRNKLMIWTFLSLLISGIGFIIGRKQEKKYIENTIISKDNLDEHDVVKADLESDSYKIFLINRYEITKNDVLDGYILKGKIYQTLPDVLMAAHELYSNSQNNFKEDSIPELAAANSINDYSNKINKDSRFNLFSIYATLAVAAILIISFFLYYRYHPFSKDDSPPKILYNNPNRIRVDKEGETLKHLGDRLIGVKIDSLGFKLSNDVAEYQTPNVWLEGNFSEKGHPIYGIYIRCDDNPKIELGWEYEGIGCKKGDSALLALESKKPNASIKRVCKPLEYDYSQQTLGYANFERGIFWALGGKNGIYSVGVFKKWIPAGEDGLYLCQNSN